MIIPKHPQSSVSDFLFFFVCCLLTFQTQCFCKRQLIQSSSQITNVPPQPHKTLPSPSSPLKASRKMMLMNNSTFMTFNSSSMDFFPLEHISSQKTYRNDSNLGQNRPVNSPQPEFLIRLMRSPLRIYRQLREKEDVFRNLQIQGPLRYDDFFVGVTNFSTTSKQTLSPTKNVTRPDFFLSSNENVWLTNTPSDAVLRRKGISSSDYIPARYFTRRGPEHSLPRQSITTSLPPSYLNATSLPFPNIPRHDSVSSHRQPRLGNTSKSIIRPVTHVNPNTKVLKNEYHVMNRTFLTPETRADPSFFSLNSSLVSFQNLAYSDLLSTPSFIPKTRSVENNSSIRYAGKSPSMKPLESSFNHILPAQSKSLGLYLNVTTELPHSNDTKANKHNLDTTSEDSSSGILTEPDINGDLFKQFSSTLAKKFEAFLKDFFNYKTKQEINSFLRNFKENISDNSINEVSEDEKRKQNRLAIQQKNPIQDYEKQANISDDMLLYSPTRLKHTLSADSAQISLKRFSDVLLAMTPKDLQDFDSHNVKPVFREDEHSWSESEYSVPGMLQQGVESTQKSVLKKEKQNVTDSFTMEHTPSQMTNDFHDNFALPGSTLSDFKDFTEETENSSLVNAIVPDPPNFSPFINSKVFKEAREQSVDEEHHGLGEIEFHRFPSTLYLSLDDACKAVQQYRAYNPRTVCCSLKNGIWTDPSLWGCGHSPQPDDVVVILHHVEMFDGETLYMNLAFHGLYILSTASQQASLTAGLPYWEICKTHLMVYAKYPNHITKPYRFPWNILNLTLNKEHSDYFQRQVSIQDICTEFLGSFAPHFYQSAEITLAGRSLVCQGPLLDRSTQVIEKNLSISPSNHEVKPCISQSYMAQRTQPRVEQWRMDSARTQDILGPPYLIIGERSALMFFNNISLYILDGGVVHNKGTMFLGANFHPNCSTQQSQVIHTLKHCLKPSLSIADDVSLLAFRPIRVARLEVKYLDATSNGFPTHEKPLPKRGVRWSGDIGYSLWLPNADVSAIIFHSGTQYLDELTKPLSFSFKYIYIQGKNSQPIVTAFRILRQHHGAAHTITFFTDAIISDASLYQTQLIFNNMDLKLSRFSDDKLTVLGDISLVAESVSLDRPTMNFPKELDTAKHRVLNVLRLICTRFCDVNHKIHYAYSTNRIQVLAEMRSFL